MKGTLWALMMVLAFLLTGCGEPVVPSDVSSDVSSDVTSGEVITESVVHEFN